MRISAFGLISGMVLFCGCSGQEGQVDVYEVSGKVTLGGGPVAKATVIFSPLDKQPVATGMTDNQGVFKLTTYDSFDGAALGKYDVMISKSVTPKSSGGQPEAHSATASGQAPAHNATETEEDTGATLDPKWSKQGNGLTAEVKSSGENSFEFKLD